MNETPARRRGAAAKPVAPPKPTKVTSWSVEPPETGCVLTINGQEFQLNRDQVSDLCSELDDLRCDW